MYTPVRPSARAAVSGICLLAALTGCVGPGSAPPRRPLALTLEEQDFADALGHFAEGLIVRTEDGPGSTVALDHFAEAARLDPNTHRLHAKVAQVRLSRKEPDEAISALEESCHNNPESAQAWTDLGTACQIAGYYERAVESYNTARTLAPENTFLYIAVARLHFQAARDDAAIAVLDAGMRQAAQPKSLIAFAYEQAKEFIGEDNSERSITCFRFVANHSPDEQQKLYHLLGELHERLEQDDAAIQSYTLATRVAQPAQQSFVRLGYLLLQADPVTAIEAMRRADELFPDEPSIILLLAYALSTQDRLADAVEAFDRVDEILHAEAKTKLSETFYLHYGGACERLGNYDKAAAVFQRGIEHFPNAHRVLNYVAYMWAEQGTELEKAHDFVTRAIQLDPANAAYLDTLGWIYYKQGKHAEALVQIRKAADLMGDDPVIADHLGDVHLALGDEEEARQQWKRSFVLDPNSDPVAEKLKARGIKLRSLRKEAERLRMQGAPVPGEEGTGDGAEDAGD